MVLFDSTCHFYNIHDIVNVSSDVPLSELSFFRGNINSLLDLVVQTGLNRSENQKKVCFKYSELGSIGASFQIDFSRQLRVIVSQLLAKSRHVLYTNVVEPLLRFLFVSKGYILLHSACLSTPIGGLLISAPPDTGKTTTILKILQYTRWRFLSDDMTILSPSGHAYCFPKPLQISLNTLQTLGYAYNKLYGLPSFILRSRIYSKESRLLMRSLGKTRIPILSLNALGQILFPPSKPPILTLIDPHNFAKKCAINSLFFIDRGKPFLKELSPEKALKRVEINSDNAFNFPPYSRIVKHLELDGFNYQELKSKERDLLRRALRNVRFFYLRLNDYSWYKYITRTLETVDFTPSILEDLTINIPKKE